MSETLRIDKWLWAARFYKTRSLAQTAVTTGRVRLNGEKTKPARGLRRGDELSVTVSDVRRVIVVRDLSAKRGPATVAQGLYEETPESIEQRERVEHQRKEEYRLRSVSKFKPHKADRRKLARLKRESQYGNS